MKHITISPITEKLASPSQLALIKAKVDAVNEKRDRVTDEQRREAIIASTKDRRAAVAFAAARRERINAYLWANNYALSFFDQIELAEKDWIEIITESDHNVNILATNVHGEAPKQTTVMADTPARYNTYKLSSGIVKYASDSVYSGSIDQSERTDRIVQRSYDQKINTTLYTLIDAAMATFPAAALIADSRIVSNTLPSTNVLSFTGEGSFTFKILKEIVDHCLLLGRGLKAIVINPTEMRDVWDWQHLVSTTSSGSQDGRTMITTRVKDEILQSGGLGGLLGQEFTFILDPIRAKKVATFFTDRPAGNFYEQLSRASITYYNEKEMEMMGYGENWEGIKMTRWVKDMIQDPQKLNFGKITFST